MSRRHIYIYIYCIFSRRHMYTYVVCYFLYALLGPPLPPPAALTSRISFACGAKTGSELAPSMASMHLPLPTIPMQKPYLLIVHRMFSHLQVMASLRSLFPSTHTASFHHPSLHLFTYTAVCQASLSYLVALVTAHCQGCRD